ncbi:MULTISPECIES: acyl carrier protein [Pseudoalteromonas]|uniref:Acyl carrier protein n=1 Tax=Pseudoalteromonas obscura TaxID=3048491 RepID=A0ABT7ETW0_9GAMM|nr:MULTISPECIES: acyl carrier protein [Pseudoalteromonas]MBQ4839053.1 acyl carrier protein [Pseudoalteromonas luteoviolacea]MDK2598489.1 acyl carrier protein [Pseudoalteromonas sp. P94(2023)]
MSSREDLFKKLSEILVEEFEIEEDSIKPDANLYDELDLDSIDAVDLVVKLREMTGKKIDPEAFKQVRTVNDVIDEMEKLLSK